jgi:diaminopimelate decarboxylase
LFLSAQAMSAPIRTIESKTIRYLSALAAVSPTPFYAIDIDRIVTRFRATVLAWKTHFPLFQCAYSFKTNALRAVTVRLKAAGAAAEVVSGEELAWAKADGYRANDIFFNGPWKSDTELRSAILLGVNLQIDSLEELERLSALPSFGSTRYRLSLRLSTHKSGCWSRFGLYGKEVDLALELLKNAGRRLDGLHFHVGSNIVNPSAYSQSIRLLRPVLRLDEIAGRPFRINIGGGYAAPSARPSGLTPDAAAYAKTVALALDSLGLSRKQIEVIIEPGRSLVEDAGWLVTRVAAIKRRNGRVLVTVESPGTLANSAARWHHPIHCESVGNCSTPVEVFGSNCFESDWLGRWRGRGRVFPHSLVFVGAAGGYDMATANTWIRSLPPVLAFSNKQWTQVRGSIDSTALRRGRVSGPGRPLQ